MRTFGFANSRGGTLAILRSAAATKRSSVETRDGPNQVTGYEALLARHVIAAQLLFGPAALLSRTSKISLEANVREADCHECDLRCGNGSKDLNCNHPSRGAKENPA